MPTRTSSASNVLVHGCSLILGHLLVLGRGFLNRGTHCPGDNTDSFKAVCQSNTETRHLSIRGRWGTALQAMSPPVPKHSPAPKPGFSWSHRPFPLWWCWAHCTLQGPLVAACLCAVKWSAYDAQENQVFL